MNGTFHFLEICRASSPGSLLPKRWVVMNSLTYATPETALAAAHTARLRDPDAAYRIHTVAHTYAEVPVPVF